MNSPALASIPADVVVKDARMSGFGHDPRVRVHFDGGRWLEGPAYSAQSRTVIFSDIPSDRTLRYDEVADRVDVFEEPARFANGRTFDPSGRLVTCLHGERSVVRREHDGSETVVAAGYEGRRLNSPNDVVVSKDGSVWFTDPTFGILTDYEGHRATSEIGASLVFVRREDEEDVRVASAAFEQPNGLAFSLDERVLYVVDSAQNTLSAVPLVDGSLGTPSVIASGHGFDGIRLDEGGRIWAGTRAGVSCFAPDGTELVSIALPEKAANLTFGGIRRNTLYITATTSLYSLRVSIVGA